MKNAAKKVLCLVLGLALLVPIVATAATATTFTYPMTRSQVRTARSQLNTAARNVQRQVERIEALELRQMNAYARLIARQENAEARLIARQRTAMDNANARLGVYAIAADTTVTPHVAARPATGLQATLALRVQSWNNLVEINGVTTTPASLTAHGGITFHAQALEALDVTAAHIATWPVLTTPTFGAVELVYAEVATLPRMEPFRHRNWNADARASLPFPRG